MKTLLGLLRLLLVIVMALLAAELQSHYVQKYIADILRQHGISFDFQLSSLNDITLQHIRYENLYIADRIHIVYEILPLLDMRIVADLIEIEGLRLKNIEKLAKKQPRHQKKSASPAFDFLIRELRLWGLYPYKGTNRVFLQAKNITKEHALISTLSLKTFAGLLKAKGAYKNQTLHLKGTASIKPIQKLHLAKSTFDLNATQKGAKLLLWIPKARYEEFNLSKVTILAQSDYKKTRASVNGLVAHPLFQAPVEANLTYDKDLRYRGHALLHIKKQNIPLRYQSYRQFDLFASGDLKSVDLNLSNPYLQAFGAVWFKERRFRLRTSKVPLKELYDQIPAKDMDLALKAQGSFDRFDYELLSNYFVATGAYEKMQTRAKVRFLRPFEKINLPALNPVSIEASKKRVHIVSSLLTIDATPQKATVTFPHATIKAQKNQNRLDLQATIDSIEKFTNELQKLYPINPIQSDLPVSVQATVDLETKRYKAHIITPPGAKTLFDYLDLQLHGDMNTLIIDYYAIVVNSRGLYATKPSKIEKRGDTLHVTLWIEDKARLFGKYDLGSKKGDFKLKARSYRYSGPEADIKSDIDIDIKVDGQKIQAEGEVELLGGLIAYEPKRGRVVEDEDIIVIDKKIQTKRESFFKKYVALSIHIGAKRPILYKIPDLYVLVKPDLLLYKEFDKDLELLGLVKILKGRYEIADGYFDIAPSQLSFYGPPQNPLLDLHLKTRKDRYIIYITVSGDAQNPILSFDSDPYLKPNEILSLLVFGSGSEALLGTLGGSRFASFLSNLFIKDLFAQLGIKLDTLSLITSGDRVGFEVGKRLSDRITIVYKNDEISTLIIRYRISDHIESEAIFGPDRSGIHVFYRNLK